MLIRRGKHVADYLHADCLAVHVERHASGNGHGVRSEALEKHLSFARNLHIETHVLTSQDVAAGHCGFRTRTKHHPDFPGARVRAPLVEGH